LNELSAQQRQQRIQETMEPNGSRAQAKLAGMALP
jgi:hypothetical protein